MDAKKLLTNAMSCEREGCKLVSNQLYSMGIIQLENLFEELDTLPLIYQKRLDEIRRHNKKLDKLIEERVENGWCMEQIFIKDNSTGCSYRSLFGKYLNSGVQEVLVYETYLRKNHQYRNLINLMELLRENCAQLRYVHVVTKSETNCTSDDTSIDSQKLLDEIKLKMKALNISFTFSYDTELHDRRILLGNGVHIKLHRGLDIYKPSSHYYPEDFDLRKCYKNNIDIFHWESFT